MVKTEISTQSTSPNKLGKSIFTRLLVTLLKLKWTPLGLQKYQKGMGNEIFCLENHARINLPATKYMFNVIKNEIEKMYN